MFLDDYVHITKRGIKVNYSNIMSLKNIGEMFRIVLIIYVFGVKIMNF